MFHIYSAIILVTIIYVSYYVLVSLKENFTSISYNSFDVPENPIQTIYSTETETLKTLLDNLNVNKNNTLPIDDNFISINPNINFPLENSFNKAIINFLHDNIQTFRKDKVYILGKLQNIRYKDISNNRVFFCNVTLVNPKNFFTRNVKIVLNIAEIQNLVLPLDTSTYKDYIETIVDKYISIQNVVLDTETKDPSQVSINGFDSLQPNMYRIKNKLHLTDPFLTSGRELIIDESMKNEFNRVLVEKNKLKSQS